MQTPESNGDEAFYPIDPSLEFQCPASSELAAWPSVMVTVAPPDDAITPPADLDWYHDLHDPGTQVPEQVQCKMLMQDNISHAFYTDTAILDEWDPYLLPFANEPVVFNNAQIPSSMLPTPENMTPTAVERIAPQERWVDFRTPRLHYA